MDVWRRNENTSHSVCTQLLTVMAHLGTPLDASWLASRDVIPYMVNHILDMSTERLKNSRRVGMVELLSHLEPHVLRDYPEFLEWLQKMSTIAS